MCIRGALRLRGGTIVPVLRGDGGWWSVWRPAFSDALAVLAPVECAGCGAPDRSLCDECRLSLAARGWCRDLDGVPVWAALGYVGVVRRAILSLKEHGRTDVASALARPLEAVLARVVAALAAERGGVAPLLVTVPSTWRARRTRGFDPVPVLLARSGLRAERVLRRVRSSPVQKGLDVAGRERNRAGSLVARRNLSGCRFVLVDDVVTSGATAREAIRAVRQAGGDVLAVVALAATQRVDGNESSRWVECSP